MFPRLLPHFAKPYNVPVTQRPTWRGLVQAPNHAQPDLLRNGPDDLVGVELVNGRAATSGQGQQVRVQAGAANHFRHVFRGRVNIAAANRLKDKRKPRTSDAPPLGLLSPMTPSEEARIEQAEQRHKALMWQRRSEAQRRRFAKAGA